MPPAATGVAAGLIHVRAARGTGRTPLSAFDAALHAAGVADHNLITLSSVVPPGVRVEVVDDAPPLGSVHGDRLYAVLSVAHAELRGQSAWAGLGWVNDPDVGGLFVEHHSGAEESVRELIDLTLDDMCRRRGRDFGAVQQVVVGVHCDDLPACALVVATYAVQPWERA